MVVKSKIAMNVTAIIGTLLNRQIIVYRSDMRGSGIQFPCDVALNRSRIIGMYQLKDKSTADIDKNIILELVELVMKIH